MIHGEPRKALKVGTMTTVDMETGETTEVRRNAGTLLPPKGDVCQVCATDHAHDQPHNQQSVYYQMAFHATHGRWPIWTDAMAHCSDEIKNQWRAALIAYMRKSGKDVPDDLMEPKPPGR